MAANTASTIEDGASAAEPNVATMFSALLKQMEQMNESLVAITDPGDRPGDEDDDLLLDDHEKDVGDVRSLDARVAQLAENQTGSDILADIAVDLDASERTGSAVSDGLAGIITSLLKEKLSDDKTQSKIEKYRRPVNVEGLRVPRVNPLIWGQLPAPVRTNDSKAQKSQTALVSSIVAMTRATDLALTNTSRDKELVTTLTDAIALALQAYHDMNGTRRQTMKKDLHKDYAALCSGTTVEPTSEFLFGDISKLAKDISEANKLTRKMRPPHHHGNNTGRNSRYSGGGRRYGSYQNNRFNPYQRGRNDFLSKGHPPRGRMRKDGAAKQN